MYEANHANITKKAAAMTLGIFLGMAADRILGDPPTTIHPVAIFGCAATKLEKVFYRDSKLAGVLYLTAAVVPPVVATRWLEKRYPAATMTLALFSALGGTTLERIGERMAQALEAGNIDQARDLVPWLCSRDPQYLDEQGIIRATVESLAENTSDAATAPILWATCGASGVVLHRLVNTLDAMVGYRSPRYENFGWAAATFDDVLAYLPARFTAGVHVAYAAARGGLPQARRAVIAWRDDAPKHPSPNAGPVEATAAGALGVVLGGTTTYAHGVEERPLLGAAAIPVAAGSEAFETSGVPTVATIREAIRLSRCVQLIAGVAAGIAAVGVGTLRRRVRRW